MGTAATGQDGPIDGEMLMELDGGPNSVPMARRAVQAWLVDRDVPGSVIERARLVVTELADNAVRHARTAFSVRVAVDGDRVVLEVADGDGRHPVVHRPDPDAVSGRGLWLVSRLSDRWGVEPRDGGKIVWVRLLVRGSATTGAVAHERHRPRGDEAFGADAACRHLVGGDRRRR